MKALLLLAAIASCAAVAAASAAAGGSNYAVLVAGSNGYYNYRHQSDICHAFHVLTDVGGFPAENIIVFMYDDIANNPQNPVKGNLINHPNGPNVYTGVNKDYTGAAVTPANFLAVLSGNSSAVQGGNGRVLPSGPNDNVFVYFSDHGAPGLIAFPSDYLYANDLMNTLKGMHTHQKYHELVFYLETCESGSMFDGLLPSNIGIFATTAATPTQSSYACYYDSSRQTYLGDEYSVRWMEDSDQHDTSTSTWTLGEQFKLVASETVQSQPQSYGNSTMANEVIQNFQGYKRFFKSPTALSSKTYTPCGSADSRDVKLETLRARFRDAVAQKDGDAQVRWGSELEAELVHRAQADYYADMIVERVVGGPRKNAFRALRHPPRNFDCLRSSINAVEGSCGRFSDYSLKHVYLFVNMCEEGFAADQVAQAAEVVCGSPF